MRAITRRHYLVNRILWAAILALLAVDVLLFRQSGLHLDSTPVRGVAWMIALMAVFCLAINIIHPQHRFPGYEAGMDTLWSFTNAVNQMTFGPLSIAFFSYLTARAGWPLIDEKLIAIDGWLGFDWREHIAWANARPFVSDIFSVGYNSFPLQIMMLLIMLPIRRQFEHVQRFIMIFFFTALAVVLLAAIFPAAGAYIHYNIDPARDFPHLHNQGGLVHKDVLLGLRDHTLATLSFPLIGLVTFPSFHAALAVLLSYGALPFRRLRFVIFVLNIIMLISVPMEGGHYLVDVIAGLIVVGVIIYFAERMVPRATPAITPI